MLIKKMDKHYDIEKIILEWNNIYRLNHWHNNNQIAIQHSGEVSYTDGCGYWSGQEENDYKYIDLPSSFDSRKSPILFGSFHLNKKNFLNCHKIIIYLLQV